MIARNETESGYWIHQGRLTLDATPVPVHPRALRDVLGAHYEATGEDLDRADRPVDRNFVQSVFDADRERTLPILARSLGWSDAETECAGCVA